MYSYLLPTKIDSLAKTNPTGLYAEYPLSTSTYEHGYRRITYLDFANAVNELAWWLEGKLGRGDGFEILAYIGPNDLRYPALILAAIKVGYVIFLTSPRNSLSAQIGLLNKLKCKTVLCPDPRPPPITSIINAREMRVLDVPGLDDLLGKKPGQYHHFEFTKTFEEARDEPVFVVHTSGSTGLPKPIMFTHDTIARNTRMMNLDPGDGYISQESVYRGKRIFMTFPPFHAAYLALHFFSAVPSGTIIVSPISGSIPSAEGLVAGLKQCPADVAFIVPSIVQELSQSPELLDYCANHLETILYCGGDVPKAMGDIVASKIRLINQFGATELGLQASLQPLKPRDTADWQYVHFHPNIGVELRPVTADVHELCVVRDPVIELSHQPTFTLFPERDLYASRDLFVQHPRKEKAHLWKWQARADDIIVFLNGEKTNPISMEQHIVFHNPKVAAALVVGAQRFQAALLIEPADSRKLSTIEKADFIEHIWHTIEAANLDCPTHARISKSHILFIEPDRPMTRAGKGTVQRAGTLALYARDIDKLYEEAEAMLDVTPEHQNLLVDSNNTEKLTEFVRHAILSATGWATLSDEDNFIELGMDSLQAITSVRFLRRGLALPGLAASTLYANASVVSLVHAIVYVDRNNKESETAKTEARVDMLKSLSTEYLSKIDRIEIAMDRESAMHPSKETIVLTGSTGALGSYLLNVLLSHSSVSHIYCLNRSANGFTVQSERNRSRGLPDSFDSSRVTFLQADLSQELLGLETLAYKELSKTTTLIIHNAWPVNFNLALQSFRPHLDGLVNLIALSARASLRPRIVFISSISSVLRYPAPIIPETLLEDPSTPEHNGYAQSKYVSELLLNAASKVRLGVPTSFVRVGQVAGAAKYPGVWNKSEWFPSLVISSLRIGALPESIGSGLGAFIDWIPIDLLADVLAELAIESTAKRILRVDDGPPTTMFHAVHPHPISWSVLRDVVASELALLSTREIAIVPFSEWIQRVRNDLETSASSAKTPEDDDISLLIASNPAVKLLDFYEALNTERITPGRLDIAKTMLASEKLAKLEVIKEDWIRKWVKEWFIET